MDLISHGWRGMIIDEMRNMGDEAGLGGEEIFDVQIWAYISLVLEVRILWLACYNILFPSKYCLPRALL
jgi:hypothetical protein